MKKLLLLTIVIIASFSCTKEDNLKIERSTVEDVSLKNEEIRFHIYFSTWDDWGRVSRDCEGWGICATQSCWWCCTNTNEVIVDCDTGLPEVNSGVANINITTGIGFLTIKLDPNVTEQLDAIRDQVPLVIDYDIPGDHFEIQNGVYAFNPSVGDNGGYLVDVIEN